MDNVLKVLVVDDEPGMRLGVARALKGYVVNVTDLDGQVSFDCEQADSGEAALEMIPRCRPAILLLDHKLPGMTGLEVLDKLADRGDPDMLTIMITAYASLETAVTAIKHGAYDFLAKPFTPEELRNTVRKAAGRVVISRQARQLAAEKRRVRFEFISVLAHELKAPLAAIEGYLHILQDRSAGSDPDVYERMIDRSLVRSEHMRKQISDLLDLTRLESGTKKRELVELDLVSVARSCIDTSNISAAGRNITISLAAPPELTLLADQGEMEVVLNNLLSNAVKYNRSGGRVTAELSQDDGKVRIAVSDTGIGLTAEEAGRLFNDFVRIKNEHTRDILGSGLGLSIVKKIALLYDGDATVKSESGVGSVFTVTLKDLPQRRGDAERR